MNKSVRNINKILILSLISVFLLNHNINPQKNNPYKLNTNTKKQKGKRALQEAFSKKSIVGSKYQRETKKLNDDIVKNDIKAFTEKLSGYYEKAKNNNDIETLKEAITQNLNMNKGFKTKRLLYKAIFDSEKSDFVRMLVQFKDNDLYISLSDVNFTDTKGENALFWIINRMRNPKYGIDTVAKEMITLLVVYGKLLLNQTYDIKETGPTPAIHLILETLKDALTETDSAEQREIAFDIITLLLAAGMNKYALDSFSNESQHLKLYEDLINLKRQNNELENYNIVQKLLIDERELKKAKLINLQHLREVVCTNNFRISSNNDVNFDEEILALNQELLN